MKRHLKKLALCFIIMILCVCINAQENNLSLSGQEDLDYLRVYDAFFENTIPPPVHDVPGIYIDIDGKEVSFNPYHILRIVEKYRREFI